MGFYDDEPYPYYDPEEFLEEYEVSLREVITKAVNDKIKKTIDDLETIKIENKGLQDKNRDLNYKINSIENQNKKDLEAALKVKEKEVERRLNVGFAVNDNVYYIKSKSNSTKCSKCNGTGKTEVEVLGKLTKVSCPHCNNGNIYTYTYSPAKDTISSFRYYISREEYRNKTSKSKISSLEINLDDYDHSTTADNLYKTLEECQVECNKKNLIEAEKLNQM